MSIKTITAHVLECDTCPEWADPEATCLCDCDHPEVEHEHWDWLKVGGRLMCPRCQEWAGEDMCGAEAGHDWCYVQHATHDGWMPADPERDRGQWRMRHCRSCARDEVQFEGESWSDYRGEYAKEGDA